MSETTTTSSGGGCGCITIILTFLLFWGLCCGVTVDGKHYDMSCSCDRGVDVESWRVE